MTAQYPTNEHDQFQISLEMSKIRVECPTFVEWLRKSVDETLEVIEATDGSRLLKESGALRDLRIILSIINNPPQVAESQQSGLNVM